MDLRFDGPYPPFPQGAKRAAARVRRPLGDDRTPARPNGNARPLCCLAFVILLMAAVWTGAAYVASLVMHGFVTPF